ncbi:MAG TPA: adenylate/guanylate cyclase domain-containing protein [Actinomycetes bacterium]|nr:adenylate/guanylate cyclase domain-containing protein [Actinomycetes bacterium]
MADDVARAQPGSLLGPSRSVRLRLVRANNVTLGTDPSLAELYHARYEGSPPRVRERGGVITIEYGPRFRPADWVGRQAADIRLSPSVGWRIEGSRGLVGLRADLTGARLLGMEVEHAAADLELTLARPAGPVQLWFRGGAREVTIHRPAGTAARVRVTGGSSGLTFDEQTYKAVAGEATWQTSGFDEATDRYDIAFSRGVRNVVVDTLELQPGQARRLLATVLFTDIVGSTERAQATGDRRWRELLDAHDEAARRLVAQEGGRRIKSTGDGVLAVFDGPGRAIRCAVALRKELEGLGIEIRAGIHTGELDVTDDDVGGIAVHIAARIMATAGPGEILVSRTVRDLVTGSGIALEDRGTHTLKGLSDPWQLFAAN